MYTSKTNNPTKFELDIFYRYRDKNIVLNISYGQIDRKLR